MKTAIMFSGQGAQKVGMGKDLHAASPLGRERFEQADAILGWKLSELCFEGPVEALTETKVCQPALYVHGYVVYELMKAREALGEVEAAMGLSLGELTACAAAGVFDFETGLKIVAERGRLMQEACEQTDGSMAAVIGVDRATVATFCEELGVEMANLNCPGQIVISGPSDLIAKSVEEGKARGFKRVMPLKVAGAYHSRLMESARAEFAKYLDGIAFNEPQIPVISNTTGKQVATAADIKEALAKQVVSSVLWEDCMFAAAEMGVERFMELGVGGVLRGHVKRTSKDWDNVSFETWEQVEGA